MSNNWYAQKKDRSSKFHDFWQKFCEIKLVKAFSWKKFNVCSFKGLFLFEALYHIVEITEILSHTFFGRNFRTYRVIKTIFCVNKCLYLLQFWSYTKILEYGKVWQLYILFKLIKMFWKFLNFSRSFKKLTEMALPVLSLQKNCSHLWFRHTLW